MIEKSGGSPAQPVGRVAFVDDLPFDKPVIFSNFLQKIRIAGDSFFPEYVLDKHQKFNNLKELVKNIKLLEKNHSLANKLSEKNFELSQQYSSKNFEKKLEETLKPFLK